MIFWSLKPQDDLCNIITTSAQLKQPHFPKKISPNIIHQIGGTGFQKPTKRQLHCRHPTAPAFHSVMSRQRFYQRVVFLCSRNLCCFLTKKTNWLIYLDLTTFQPVFNSLILCGFLVLPCVGFFLILYLNRSGKDADQEQVKSVSIQPMREGDQQNIPPFKSRGATLVKHYDSTKFGIVDPKICGDICIYLQIYILCYYIIYIYICKYIQC